MSHDDYQDYYPCVYLPQGIQMAMAGDLPQKPVEPIMPTKPNGRSIGNMVFHVLFWGPFFVLSALIIWLIVITKLYSLIIVGEIVAVVCGLILKERMVSKYNLVKSSVMKNMVDAYNEALAEYNKEKEEYEITLCKYESAKKIYQSSSPEEYKRRSIAEYLKNYSSPLFESYSSDEVKHGPGESLFIQYLKKISPKEYEYMDNIKTKCISQNGFECYYYPDVVLREKTSGLFVDIEIDEPYIAKTGKPIHFEDEDSDRNAAMVSDNWIVFRFAEEQIVKSPGECLSFVTSFFLDLIKVSESYVPLMTFARNYKKVEVTPFTNRNTGESFKALVFTDQADNRQLVYFSSSINDHSPAAIVELKHELLVVPGRDGDYFLYRQTDTRYYDIVMKRWSYDDALNMATSNYRQSYLPTDIWPVVFVPPKENKSLNDYSINDLPF